MRDALRGWQPVPSGSSNKARPHKGMKKGIMLDNKR